MATERDHLKKATENQQFLDTLDDSHPDWLLTVGFYKSVHLVEALFARKGRHSENHTNRNHVLRQDHPDIWTDFKPLYDNSRLVRYNCTPMTAAVVRAEYLGKRLPGVERKVLAALASLPLAQRAATTRRATASRRTGS